MTRPPRVSIGVPVYNGERYLRQALDSLISQTFDDLEIIVCDNASSDQTQGICREYVQRDSRVAYHRNDANMGAAANFVRCLEFARGEYFRWNCADDYSARTLVEKCVEVLDRREDVVQVYGRTVLVDEAGEVLEQYDDGLEALDDRPSVRYEKVTSNIGLVNGYYGLFRSDLLRKTRVHGSFPGADVLVQQEISLYGKIVEIPEPLFFRRMHAEAHSAMSALEKEQFYDPGATAVRGLVHWRHLRERLGAARRSPLGLREKLAVMQLILRGAIWSRGQYIDELKGYLRSAR